MIPNSLRIKLKCSSGSFFVKISANWNSVGINSRIISWFCTWSRRKWCRTSICIVLECRIGFFDRLIALVLSHLMGVVSNAIPKSLSSWWIHKTFAHQLPMAIYSASAIDNVTEFCFLENHKISLVPKTWQVPEVLFLSTLHPTKLASEYPIRSILSLLGYQRPTSWDPLRYLKILSTANKWDSLEFDWKWAHRQTLNMMFYLLLDKVESLS